MSTDLNDSHAAIDAALNTLNGLGRLGDAHGVINDVAGSTNYGAIDADQTHTPDAKLDRYSSAYSQAMDTLAQRLGRAAAIAKTQAEDDHAAAFGIVNPHLAHSHRDATDRANAINDPRARRSELANAIADGDTIYAAALAKTAVADGDLASVNAFSDAFPHLNQSLQRSWDSARSKGDVRRLGLAAYNAKSALKPGAISHLAPYQISTRAQNRKAES